MKNSSSDHGPIRTAADYRATPYGPPWHQLVEGELMVMESPSRFHQGISRNLVFALLRYLDAHPIGQLYFAPFDVYLNDINVYQPDIVVVLNERRQILTEDGARGSPDFVVEIISPSTRRLDLGHKKKVYAQSGVRELWIVDPELQTIDAYHLHRQVSLPAQNWGPGESAISPLFPGFSVTIATIFA